MSERVMVEEAEDAFAVGPQFARNVSASLLHRPLAGKHGWDEVTAVADSLRSRVLAISRDHASPLWWLATTMLDDRYDVGMFRRIGRHAGRWSEPVKGRLADVLLAAPPARFVRTVVRCASDDLALVGLEAVARRIAKGQTVTLGGNNFYWSNPGDELDQAIELVDDRRRAAPFAMGAVIGTLGRVQVESERELGDAVPIFQHVRAEPHIPQASARELEKAYEPYFISLLNVKKLAAPAYATKGFAVPVEAHVVRALLTFAAQHIQDGIPPDSSRELVWRRYGLLSARRSVMFRWVMPFARQLGCTEAQAQAAMSHFERDGQHRLIARFGNSVLIDLVGASGGLQDHFVRPADGRDANIWGANFEEQLQQEIDVTPWAPSAAMRPLIGSKLRRPDGTTLTDVDAIADTGGTILVIDTKSYPITSDILSGQPAPVETRRRNVEDAARNWAQKMPEIRQAISARVSVPDGRAVDGLVVIPEVPFVHLGVATEFVVAGLRRVSSATEFLRACTGNP